jgi:hypothetical protein
MSEVHSLLEHLISPDEKKELEKMAGSQIKGEVSGELSKVADSTIMKVGEKIQGESDEKKDAEPKSIKDKYKIFKCSICNEECKKPFYKCASENDTCREIHICQSCKDTHKPNHQLVKNDMEIHRYYCCDGCQATPIVGKRYNCLHPECKSQGKDYCENGCSTYHKVHVLVPFDDYKKELEVFNLSLKKRKLKDNKVRRAKQMKEENEAREKLRQEKKKKDDEKKRNAKKKAAGAAEENKEDEAADKEDEVVVSIVKAPEEIQEEEDKELLSLASVKTYDYDKDYKPGFNYKDIDYQSERVDTEEEFDSDYDYYEEDEEDQPQEVQYSGEGEVNCDLCKHKIVDPSHRFKCLVTECKDNIYCQNCKVNEFHMHHNIFDTKSARGNCDSCYGELSADPNKFYNCIEDNLYKYCEACAQQTRCDWGHPLVTHALYKKIVKESDFGLLCRYNKDFLDEIQDICDDEWKKRNDKIDAEKKKRADKKEMDKAKWLKENPGEDYEAFLDNQKKRAKEEANKGITKANEDDEDSESDSDEEDENDDKLYDEEFKAYLKLSKLDRQKDQQMSGYKFFIREVIFMLSPDTFNSIQALTQDKFDFRELFFLRLNANLFLYTTSFKKYRWGGWTFDKCETLKDYSKKDKLMKIHFSVGVSHVKDDFFFDSMVHAPTFFCFLYRQIGTYAHHLHGHIKIGDHKPRKEVFNLKISKCKFCKKKHFHMPLTVTPDACAKEEDGSGANEENKGQEVSDGGDVEQEEEGDEFEDGDEYDEGDGDVEGGEEKPETTNTKEYLKISGKRFIRPFKKDKSTKQYILEKGNKIPEDIGFWMRLCVFPSYLKGTNFHVDTDIHKKDAPEYGFWKFFYFLDITHTVHMDTRLFTLRFLWIIILMGMIMDVFTLPLDLFILIIYLGYPNAEKLAIRESFKEKRSYFNKLVVLGIIFGAYWGFVTIEGIIRLNSDAADTPPYPAFYLAFCDLTVLALIAEVLILSIGTAKMNRSGIFELKRVKDKVDDFYSKLDIRTSVEASSECTKVKAERSLAILDLSVLEISSSFGLVLNACILGLGIFLGKNLPSFLQTFFYDPDALLSRYLLGEGDSQWFYQGVMYVLLGMGLLALAFKVGVSFFITMQSDELVEEIETAAKILSYAQKHPDPIIVTEEVFKSQLTHETKVNLKLISLKADKMGLKYSHECRKVTDMVLKSVMRQILDDTSEHVMTLKELKDKICETCHMSEVRIKHVEDELKDLTAAIQYKFLGYWKVDKSLITKLSATAGAAISAAALALINGGGSKSK